MAQCPVKKHHKNASKKAKADRLLQETRGKKAHKGKRSRPH